MDNIIALFLAQAHKNPDAIAIIEKNKSVSFATLLDEVKETAAYFHKKGIKANDRVLVFVPISLDLYRSVLALFYIGATAVFIDEWVSFKRLSVCCKIAECKGFIAPFKLSLLSYLSSDLRKIKIRLNLNGRVADQNNLYYQASKDTTALITFTTGSTGTPKAANRTHEFLHAQFSALQPLLDVTAPEIDLTMLPIVLLLNLGLGKTSVIPQFNTRKPQKFKPEVLATQIKDHQVAVLTSSPFYLIRLSQYLIQNKIKLPSIHKLFTGGAPVFPHEAQLINEAFPNAKATIVFGSTEAEPISHVDSKDLAKSDENLLKGLCVGAIDKQAEVLILPIQESAISINNETELQNKHLSNGTIGEICVAGKHVLTSYIKNPEAIKMNKISTDKKVWHRTGDAGYIGVDNQLYLVGRCKQIVVHKGKTFYPFLVEDFCRKQKGVEMGTLVVKNQQPVLVLQVNSFFSKTAFESTAKSNDLDFEIVIIKNIPRDQRHFSKIDYSKLEIGV